MPIASCTTLWGSPLAVARPAASGTLSYTAEHTGPCHLLHRRIITSSKATIDIDLSAWHLHESAAFNGVGTQRFLILPSGASMITISKLSAQLYHIMYLPAIIPY